MHLKLFNAYHLFKTIQTNVILFLLLIIIIIAQLRRYTNIINIILYVQQGFLGKRANKRAFEFILHGRAVSPSSVSL